jgi:hypothetical protein
VSSWEDPSPALLPFAVLQITTARAAEYHRAGLGFCRVPLDAVDEANCLNALPYQRKTPAHTMAVGSGRMLARRRVGSIV